MREGDAAHQIIASARAHDAGIIVVGTRGQTGLRRLVLGSVARNVLLHAPCSVLVVREGARLDGVPHRATARGTREGRRVRLIPRAGNGPRRRAWSVPPACMTFSWVRTRSGRVCSGPDDLAGPREAPTCCLRGGPARGRLQPGRPVTHAAAGIRGGRPAKRGGPVRGCLVGPIQLARLPGEPGAVERLRERIPVCAGPPPARLRGAHQGHPQRRDGPAARHRQGEPDRVAVRQPGWARRHRAWTSSATGPPVSSRRRFASASTSSGSIRAG